MKLFENLKKWVGGLFSDEKGSPSSKRLVGIMCSITLCGTMYHNSFSPAETVPAPYLVDAVALLAFGCLGLSSIDKFTAVKRDIKNATSQEPTEQTQNTESTLCAVCSAQPCTCS